VPNSTTKHSPFEIVYGFNPLTPLDLLPLPLDESLLHRDGEAKASFVKKLHAKVKTQVEKKMEHYAWMANKKKKPMVFAPRDWVWVHFRKERFPNERKSQLHPRGEGPSKWWKRSTTTHIELIFKVNIMFLQLSMFVTSLLLM
jgi:hypothetical protein